MGTRIFQFSESIFPILIQFLFSHEPKFLKGKITMIKRCNFRMLVAFGISLTLCFPLASASAAERRQAKAKYFKNQFYAIRLAKAEPDWKSKVDPTSGRTYYYKANGSK